MLMNPHNNPHQPPPGSMPPAQYGQYGQMPNMHQSQHNMQPYSPMDYNPCSPMPPQPMHPPFPQATPLPGGYPCSPLPPTSNAMQPHPAFHQTPQLPGGYPCSPSRRPPSNHPANPNMQHVNDWLGNYNNQPYSPAPSVAPSVMSHTSVNLPPPCDGSMMSVPSMMHCPTPDLRPPSVLSGMSCSENLDPNMMAMMQNGAHPPVPHPQPQSIPEQVAVVCDLFDKGRWQHGIYRLQMLRKMFDESIKKLEFDSCANRLPRIMLTSEFDSCANLLPRILLALGWREAQSNTDLMDELSRSFCSFTNGLSEKVVLTHFLPQQQPQNNQVFKNLVMAALSPLYCHYFSKFLDTIIQREASKQERKILRNQQFIDGLVKLLTPPQMGETFRSIFLFLLSIASRLASGHDETVDALMKEMIIPKLFHNNGLHRMCMETLLRETNEHNVRIVLKTVRHMFHLLDKMVHRKDKKCMPILSEIATYGGLHAITEYMFYLRNRSRERDYIDDRGSAILEMYEAACKQNQQLNQKIMELPSADRLVTNILFILRRSPFLHRSPDDLSKGNIRNDVLCLVKLGTFLSHLTDVNLVARTALADNFRELVVILAEFNIWFTRCKQYRSDASGVGKEFEVIFKKQANGMINYQDTLVYIGNKVVEDCAKRGILDLPTTKLLLEVTVRMLEVDSVSDWANEQIREIVRRTCFMMRKIVNLVPQLVSTDLLLTTVGSRKENILSTSFNAISTILEHSRTSMRRDDEEKLIQTVARIFGLLGMVYNQASSCNPPSAAAQQVKNNIVALITNNYTPVVAEWLGKTKEFCDRTSQAVPLNNVLTFCEVVSKDTQVAKFWATCEVGGWLLPFFDSLSNSQDPEQSSRAQHIVEELRKHQLNTSDLTSDYMHMMICNM